MKKTLSNPTADLLNQVCSWFFLKMTSLFLSFRCLKKITFLYLLWPSQKDCKVSSLSLNRVLIANFCKQSSRSPCWIKAVAEWQTEPLIESSRSAGAHIVPAIYHFNAWQNGWEQTLFIDLLFAKENWYSPSMNTARSKNSFGWKVRGPHPAKGNLRAKDPTPKRNPVREQRIPPPKKIKIIGEERYEGKWNWSLP